VNDREQRQVGVTAIVLAGGRSSRFDGDKLESELDGSRLLDRAVAAALAVADEVIVAGRAIDTTIGRLAVRSIDDAEPFGGPLLALAGALAAASGLLGIVVGGDMPRLEPGVLRAMLDELARADAVDAVILGRPYGSEAAPGPSPSEPPRRQVLPLALRVQPAERAARVTVEAGRHSLQALLDRMAVVELPASAWLPLDPDANTLLDVDTEADLDRIRARMAH
jgi:molybdopterin-guanine dinucleotide biosynthesis protein A